MNKKNYLAKVLSIAMAICLMLPILTSHTYAAHPETMTPPKKVTVVGAKSFYKVDTSKNTVIYADRDDGSGWTPVPSSYISGSDYNDGTNYGAYVVKGDKVIFVDLTDCHKTTNGSYEYYHATEDSATVSKGVDTSSNKKPNMGTDFYLNIQNGIDPDGPSHEDTSVSTTSDNRISYEITVQTKSSYQLKATVPMYVCMYGYRGTGDVVTPSANSYKLKNYSTVNDGSKATIVDIVKLTKYTQIIDNNHSNEQLAAIAYNTKTKEYRWWYSTPSQNELTALGADWVVNKDIASEKLNASDECYVIYINNKWDFKVAGVLENGTLRETVKEVDAKFPLNKAFIFNGYNFGTTPKVGDTVTGGKDKGLGIKVTELQAQPATWTMIPSSTKPADMKRGELVMSVAPSTAIKDASAIDLSKCSASVDITERGWFLSAPQIGADGKNVDTPTELPLITNARMAGGNVNPSGCTQVVRVIYTIAPMFDIDNGQTDTITGDGVVSNRK